MDFCGKLSGFADFETGTVDRGSAVIFDTDSGLCLSYVRILHPKRNSALVGMLMNSSKLFLFSKEAFKLRSETVIGIVLL